MKKGTHRWNEKEFDYLIQNVGKKTFEEIGLALGRSTLAIQLKVHREKLKVRPEAKRNLIVEMFTLKFGNPDYFSVTSIFLKAVKINQVRFWALYRGEVTPTNDEFLAIANTLGISLEDAFNVRQLNLFEE